MRKRLVILNSLLIFASLFFIILIMSLTMKSENIRKSETQLKKYLVLANSGLSSHLAYQEPSKALEATGKEMHSSDSSLRLTFIDLEGTVLFDTSKEEIGENHLFRPEIQSLGTISYRYSETLKTNMMYVACLDSSSCYYIRLSMPEYDINGLVYNLVLYGSLAGLGLFCISVLADYYLTKQAFKPLKEESERLSSIVGLTSSFGKEDETLAMSEGIRKAGEVIQEKVSSLNEEKAKLSFILDTLADGLMILDADLKVIIANQSMKTILKSDKKEDLTGIRLDELTVSQEINSLSRKASYGTDGSLIKTLSSQKTYLISFYAIKEVWCSKEDRYGVGINFSDITEENSLQVSKRDFFANASHELKSPLTSIIGYSQLIASGMITDKKEEQDSLNKILEQAKRMNQIIIQMLELSKLESDYAPLSQEQDADQVISDIAASLQEEAHKQGVSLSIEGQGFKAKMEKGDMESLFRNLIENGIRYNHKGGHVISILDKEKRTVIVKDDGLGISMEDQTRVFERFYRVDKARSTKLGGTGLGLSIVKHLCLIYHIGLKLESKLGEGSSFILSFLA